MSNVDYNVALANVYRVLRRTILFLGIGWTILFFGFATAGKVFNFSIGPLDADALFIIIGLAIAGWPVIVKIFFGGGISGLFSMDADYEVVTVDGAGRVLSSDGGFQSMSGNILMNIVLAGVMLILGFIIQFIRVFILTGKYSYYRAKATVKPAFKESAMFLHLIGIALFVFSLILNSIVQNVDMAMTRAAIEKRVSGIAIGSIVIANHNEQSLYEKADRKSTILKKIPAYASVTKTAGEPVKADKNYFMLPVEYQGTRGWVYSGNFNIPRGTATVTTAGDMKGRTSTGRAGNIIMKVQSGETILLLDDKPFESLYLIWYDGKTGFMHERNLKINK